MDEGKGFPQRRTGDLHKGRISLSQARYFITCSVEDRRPVLANCCAALTGAIDQLKDNMDCVVRCGTIMPDHLHLVIVLGEHLSVGQVVGKMKTLTRRALAEAGARWQRDFFEHRLRPEEGIDPYARYVFLNAYRAGLVSRTEQWPHWFCDDQAKFDFGKFLDGSGCPPVEWLECDLARLGLQASAVGE